jgi:DNA-binding response OmpR family regulator
VVPFRANRPENRHGSTPGTPLSGGQILANDPEGAVTDCRRILVVDDDVDIQALTSTVLAGAGYEVSQASGGPEALAALRRDGFDLVLLDINMPDMSGWETLRLIRADETLASLPVVMFSVKGQVRDKVHAMQEGAADYITKPFVVDELLARVERVLDPAARGA